MVTTAFAVAVPADLQPRGDSIAGTTGRFVVGFGCAVVVRGSDDWPWLIDLPATFIPENANVAVADKREGDVRWPGCA
jgi:hypothetical protein